jgi:hypothetical protein
VDGKMPGCTPVLDGRLRIGLRFHMGHCLYFPSRYFPIKKLEGLPSIHRSSPFPLLFMLFPFPFSIAIIQKLQHYPEKKKIKRVPVNYKHRY